MTPGARVQITYGLHFARKGKFIERRIKDGQVHVAVELDRALPSGKRVVTVHEDHVCSIEGEGCE